MSGRITVHETGQVSHFGGMFDPVARDWCRDRFPAEPACEWVVSEQQLRVLQFYQDRPAPRCVMIGGMGAGKTAIAARAAVLLATKFANADIGIVGPTQQKLGPMIKKFGEVLPKSWIEKAQWHALFEPPYVRLVNGVRFQFLGAKAPSKAMGSPIHGFD